MAKNPFAAFEKKDAAKDKKAGIKEGSPADMKMDAKGMKGMKGAKVVPFAKTGKK